MNEEAFRKLAKSIKWNKENNLLTIGERQFKISPKIQPISGTKKTAFLLENEKQFIKVIKTDNPDLEAVFKAMDQTFIGQVFLSGFEVPFPEINEFDPEGPPFRFFIQDAIPDGSISAAELIKNNTLSELDIKQMAGYINKFEIIKKWQLDTNPFNWHRVTKNNITVMTYVDGKIYPFENKWSFKNVGLLQWTDPKYLDGVTNKSANIPTATQTSEFAKLWKNSNSEQIKFWKKYLDPRLQP